MKMSLRQVIEPQLLEITRSRRHFVVPERGFDQRRVRYEEIHNIANEDFDKLVDVVDPQVGESILDAGCGYGSVTREILSRFPGHSLDIALYDLHEAQLNRAVAELSDLVSDERGHAKISLVHGDICSLDLESNSVDKIVAKMVIHEIPKERQLMAFRELHRVLRPGGKLVIWDLALTANNQRFFQRVIRSKDALAGFLGLIENRYFLREDELKKLALSSGFESMERNHIFTYRVDTERRLRSEFNGDRHKLQTWNAWIRDEMQELPKKVKNSLRFNDHGDSIRFQVEKGIFSCHKTICERNDPHIISRPVTSVSVFDNRVRRHRKPDR